MTTILAALYDRFEEGGGGMYPLVACWIVCAAIILERGIVLFLGSSLTTSRFESDIKACILTGNLSAAIALCAKSRAPAARVVRAGLAAAAQPSREVQVAMDLAALGEAPRIARGTPYLAVTANLGILFGLLGTITGWTSSCFHCPRGESVDPSQKARVLAVLISESMNCSAFGLFIAVVSVGAMAVLKGRAKRLQADMSYVSVHLVGLVVANRDRLGSTTAAAEPQGTELSG
jgi:biopolymer transport protein ExbB